MIRVLLRKMRNTENTLNIIKAIIMFSKSIANIMLNRENLDNF